MKKDDYIEVEQILAPTIPKATQELIGLCQALPDGKLANGEMVATKLGTSPSAVQQRSTDYKDALRPYAQVWRGIKYYGNARTIERLRIEAKVK